jgi:dUTP pyrophosphatase
MGLIISYYLKPQSLQLLEDYMKPCISNSVSYSQYKDLYYYDNSFTDACANTNANTCDDDSEYYKLYIYVHNASANEANLEVKNMYEESSNKHNAKVDSYLKSCSTKLLNAEEAEENKFVDCYDSGFDLFCPENIEWQAISTYMLDHHISCAMTYRGKFVGYYLYMRSSTPVKTPLRLANNVGIIDSGYRGTIKAYFDIQGSNFNFVKGHRYMQICPPDIGKPVKVVVVDSLSVLGLNNARSKGGYGSTGN